MSMTKKFSEVTPGGDKRDNPDDLNTESYNFEGDEKSFSYTDIDVIAFHRNLNRQQQVTGKARLNNDGIPMTSANDLVYLPCPPFCDRND